MPTNSFDDFIESLIKEKGYRTMIPAFHQQVKADLHEKLHDYINARLIAALSDKDADELSNLLDRNPTDQQLQDFFAKHLRNQEELLVKSLFDFRRTYLGLR